MHNIFLCSACCILFLTSTLAPVHWKYWPRLSLQSCIIWCSSIVLLVWDGSLLPLPVLPVLLPSALCSFPVWWGAVSMFSCFSFTTSHHSQLLWVPLAFRLCSGSRAVSCSIRSSATSLFFVVSAFCSNLVNHTVVALLCYSWILFCSLSMPVRSCLLLLSIGDTSGNDVLTVVSNAFNLAMPMMRITFSYTINKSDRRFSVTIFMTNDPTRSRPKRVRDGRHSRNAFAMRPSGLRRIFWNILQPVLVP